MSGKYFVTLLTSLLLLPTWESRSAAQEEPHIRVVVNMVQLNVAVTDKSGRYITALRPEDFLITEDGIPEKIATFAEGDEPARSLLELSQGEPTPGQGAVTESSETADSSGLARPPANSSRTLASAVTGAKVFVLFDTSNYMYRGFVFAQDAIADFVRSLDTADQIAFYSYSRDLFRASPLTSDRAQVLRAVRSTVVGDDAALYNALLLTVKDAAQYSGRKVVVVFSNGPDNSSVVPPEDVAELAQSTGISVYMISTHQARLEPVSTAVFERMTAATGGQAYFSKSWKDERRAFESVRDDLAHLYSLSYYPAPNHNGGWRAIAVRLSGEKLRHYRVRTRNGYRPEPSRFSEPKPAAQTSFPGSPAETDETRDR
jgi:Ca-activated chloride channel family protein